MNRIPSMTTRHLHHARPRARGWPVVALLVATLSSALAGEAVAPTDPLEGSGPLKLLAISPLGGPGDDDIVGVGIGTDHGVVLVGNTVQLGLSGVPEKLLGPAGTLQPEPPPAEDKKGKKEKPTHPSTHGFIVRLTPDGRKAISYTHFGYGQATIDRLRLDDQGNLLIVGDNLTGADLGGGPGKGPFIAKLSGDAQQVRWILYRDHADDVALDGNGDLVVLAGAKLTRFAGETGKEAWSVTWSAHGGNRPGAMTVSPQTGVAVVVGYGMTSTGHEPYKDPYAHAFDRSGKPLWSLWNPDPKQECDAKFGGNGLMADTTGHAAGVTLDGKILLMLYADGGNTVCSHDPADPFKPLDKEVFAGVHQGGPGYGFHGANKTSVIFRIDGQSGKLEKGTWMSAWLSPQHANGLSIDAACGDAEGNTFVAGGSAWGCPLKDPWYPFIEGTYKGGGYLALLDRDFKLRQCGYFAHSGIHCVAARGGSVVIGGNVKDEVGADGPKDPVKFFKAIQPKLGGERDGYFAVFHLGGESAR